MASGTDKAAGIANKVAGAVKEVVGKAIGSERLEADGATQKTRGEAQKKVGEIKDAIKETANRATGKTNKKL